MSSRNTRPPKVFTPKLPVLERDFPRLDELGHRMAVCSTCHKTLVDSEPSSKLGEFYHTPVKWYCANAGRFFTTASPEIEPFLPKSRRRYLRRNKLRA